MKLRLFAAAAALAAVTLPTQPASATDFYAEGTLSGGASSWPDDPNVLGALHLGFEFLDIISPEVLLRLGYGAVDERILALVGVGVKVAIPIEPFTPYLRATAIHAHETPIDAMGDDHFGHVMGVGDGIRHRFGVEGAIGATITFAKIDRTSLQAKVEGFVDAFPDERGPVVNGGAGLGLGVQVDL
jgi:hypothetical protein